MSHQSHLMEPWTQERTSIPTVHWAQLTSRQGRPELSDPDTLPKTQTMAVPPSLSRHQQAPWLSGWVGLGRIHGMDFPGCGKGTSALRLSISLFPHNRRSGHFTFHTVNSQELPARHPDLRVPTSHPEPQPDLPTVKRWLRRKLRETSVLRPGILLLGDSGTVLWSWALGCLGQT